MTSAPASFLYEQLRWVLEDAKEKNPLPVSILTTEQRDNWYHARERLRKSKVYCFYINFYISEI